MKTTWTLNLYIRGRWVCMYVGGSDTMYRRAQPLTGQVLSVTCLASL